MNIGKLARSIAATLALGASASGCRNPFDPDKQELEAPRNFTVSETNNNDGRVALNWQSGDSRTKSYTVRAYVRGGPNTGAVVLQQGRTDGTSFAFTGLPNTQLFYSVQANGSDDLESPGVSQGPFNP